MTFDRLALCAEEVLGIENNKDGIVRVSLGVVSVPDPVQIGGFFYSSIDLAQSDRFSGYMVRVVEGGKQNRLIPIDIC